MTGRNERPFVDARDIDAWTRERSADRAAMDAAAVGADPAAAAERAYATAPQTYPEGWWVDIREASSYELDEQGDAARHIGCKVDSRPFPVGAGRSIGVTLEAFLIAVAKHRNSCHGGSPE